MQEITVKRGFAAMDKEKRQEIARLGGLAAHEKGSAHRFNAEEAKEAGRKGGRAVSQDKAHMSEIGKKGGLTSRQRNSSILETQQ